jgi:hypothetical protein
MKDCFQKNFRLEIKRQGSWERKRTRYKAGKKNQTELLAGSVELNERNIQIIKGGTEIDGVTVQARSGLRIEGKLSDCNRTLAVRGRTGLSST